MLYLITLDTYASDYFIFIMYISAILCHISATTVLTCASALPYLYLNLGSESKYPQYLQQKEQLNI